MALMNRSVWLIALVLAGQVASRAGSLRKVWELDVRKVVRGTPSANAANLPVQLLQFSPDGQQLAVAVEWDLSPKVFKSQLLVIEAHHPEGAAKQFEISAGVGNEEMPGPLLFGWSSNGKTLLVAGKAIHLENGTTCEPLRLTTPPYWPSALIGNDRLIRGGPDQPDGKAIKARMDALHELLKNSEGYPIKYPPDFPPAPPEPKSHFKFFDEECQPQGEWEVAEKWDIHDVSIDRGLLAITREVGSRKYELLIVDPFARKIMRRWSSDNGPHGQFADGGKAMCGGGDVEEKGKAPLTCWNADSGEKIGVAPTINGGEPMATAAHSSRIVASDSHRRWPLFFYDYYETVLDRRVVWDFRSGKEIASWRPQYQSFINSDNEETKRPFQFAISPDGQYIAEGGNGIVRLYRIEP